MRLDDCYHLLDLTPDATDEEIRNAHRDLMKVWHPDRFGSDADLRRKAEAKLKAINEAHDLIRASRSGSFRQRREPAGPVDVERTRIARIYSLACTLLAFFILIRRPTLAGPAIAITLFVVAWFLAARARR